MDLNFKYEDTGLLVTATLLLTGIAVITHVIAGATTALLATGIAGFVAIFGLLLNIYRTRALDDIAHNEHIQALLQLHRMIDIREPLPMLTGWAASPQLACTIVSLMRERRPETIVELGSGSSTLIMGYAAEQAGHGRVVALDHLEKYGEQTHEQIRRHGLEEWAEVCYAPLTDVKLNGETWRWYTLDQLDVSTVDMLIVDGPPHKTRSKARYPAVPMLIDRLSDGAVVVLDDAYREAESEIAATWARNHGFDLSIEPSPYGTAVLRRKPSA
jgi:predicted O-methyltransferase YrrM